MRRASHAANARRFTILCTFVLLSCISTAMVQLLMLGINSAYESTDDDYAAVETSRSSSSHPLLPSCHPYWNNGPVPVSRIYFYHFRKAGGTMIREYLRKVAAHHGIDLQMKEYHHASTEEEVGSRSDTFYVTNMRDPVERSVSHFKYFGRWDCDQLMTNETFVPTKENAKPFESWSETGGFDPSPCDVPFSLVSCAVNCYVQTYSGCGCSSDRWFSEYNMALDRLLRYNMILVYEKFKDPRYVEAVEEFFGVGGFNEPADMFCGRESREANGRVPLRVKFEHVRRLTKLNEMDNRLYKDVVTSCWADAGEGGKVEYSFPKVDASLFVAPKNRTVIG